MLKPRALSLFIFLSIIWLLLSGHYNPLMLFFGLISVLFTTYIATRMDLVDKEGHPVHLTWKIPIYWLWLLLQIIKSNIQVSIRILSPKININPEMIMIPMNQKSDLDRTNYANSITLTPGTVSVRLDESGDILVHSLDNIFAKELKAGLMEKKIKNLGN
ncbi:MAG: cation transporter [Rhodospirillaceae bacterium]|nr:cation transporter [Rhodospirillaceae bacterium]